MKSNPLVKARISIMGLDVEYIHVGVDGVSAYACESQSFTLSQRYKVSSWECM